MLANASRPARQRRVESQPSGSARQHRVENRPSGSARRPRRDKISEKTNKKGEPKAFLRRETHLCLHSGAAPTPLNDRQNQPGEAAAELVHDPDAASHLKPGGGKLARKADGGDVEAHLGRRADGAGGVAIARLGRTPCGARRLPGWALMVPPRPQRASLSWRTVVWVAAEGGRRSGLWLLRFSGASEKRFGSGRPAAACAASGRSTRT